MNATGNKKLLVVDDEFLNRDLLARRLERAGYAVATAASAAEALKALERETFELVLLDNMMPGMTGLSLLQLLRATRSAAELPVIMVTAMSESERVVEALNLGANDYVTKPIDFPVALARIRAQLSRREVDRTLRQSEERYSLAAQGSKDGLWDWDLRAGSLYLSPRWRQLVGETGEQMATGLDAWLSRIHPEDRAQVDEHIAAARQLGATADFESEYRLQHADGAYRWMVSRAMAQRDNNGRLVRLTGSQTDVTQSKVYDSLTGLPNRTYFQEAAERLFERRRNGECGNLAVLLMGLDQFKIVNESLGPKAGDHLLVEVAKRLRSAMRLWCPGKEHVLARLRGDEFAILMELKDFERRSPHQLSASLPQALVAPVKLEGRSVFPSASIGFVTASDAHLAPEDLLRDADTALSQAKLSGQSRAVAFEPAMRQAAVDRLEMESDLKRAIEQGEFRLFYQPKVDLTTRRLAGFEALIRWQHPEKGLLAPDRFIGVAEQTGLIVRIGEWVLKEACRTLRDWQQRYPSPQPLEMSVNLSVRQFRTAGLAEQVKRAIDTSGIAANTLQLEVTESILIQDLETVFEIFRGLKALGVGLKIDDFGTGYSSLQYLTQLPFDTLKIDRSFVFSMCQDNQSMDVVKTIVELARNLGMGVVAEGVETSEQVERLRELGCEFGQGYYFSRPVPADQACLLITPPETARGQ